MLRKTLCLRCCDSITTSRYLGNFHKIPKGVSLLNNKQTRFIRHQTIHEGSIINNDDDDDDISIQELREDIDDILEECNEFDEIQYKTYSLQKKFDKNDHVKIENNSISFNVYPKPYYYGDNYRQSFPINEIIEYLQKLGSEQIKVYDVNKCDNNGDNGYGMIEDKDWFIISIVSNYNDLGNIIKKLIRQGHERKVHRDSYYSEVYSSYFSSEGESDWCLIDLADSLILVCHKQLLNDPLSIINSIKDKFWPYLFSTYYPFKNY